MRPEVWAPFADRVDLVTADGRSPMRRDADDWWRADVELDAGTDYGFSLDGGKGLPDPRSRHQPEGVHGPSRVVELDPPEAGKGFDLATAVIYELHIGTFTPAGTFAGAEEGLDHLVDLGVDVVEVMPVNQFPGAHGWGYDGVDLYAVHDAYGGPDGFRTFVEACHRRGLGVILDVVYNHLGPDGNHLGRFGPYFTDVYETPWGDAVNLDGRGSDEVRRFFVDNALMWLRDYGVDGLRVDAVHAFVDRSAVHFLEQLAAEVADLEAETGRRLHVIAESDLNDPRLLWSRDRGGYGLDASWSDDFHHALHAALTGETDGYYADFGSLADVAEALRSVYVYAGRHSRFRGRRHGRPVDALAGTRFLGYIQNHDQVGNRAQGQRIAHLAGPDLQRIGAALVLTSPFVPMLFQGEEWAASTPFPYFSDHQDPELGAAVREGRRAEFAAFGWDPAEIPDPQDPTTFQSAVLDWSELDADPHRGMRDWYRDLIALRRATPDLTDGRLDRVSVEADDDRHTIVVNRGSIVVAANPSADTRSVPIPPGASPVLTSGEHHLGHDAIDLGPHAVAILRLDQ